MKLWQRFSYLSITVLLVFLCVLTLPKTKERVLPKNHKPLHDPVEIPVDLLDVVKPNTQRQKTRNEVIDSECIEVNICRNGSHKGRHVYQYTRQFQFYVNLSRKINYDVNVSNNVEVVPRVVHFTWIKGGDNVFKFVHLLSLIAAQRFATPERVYFWHDELPVGPYWEEALNIINNMFLVHRDRMTHIYGKPLLLPIHVSDVMRLEALLEYGGMFFDLDAIVVNDISPLLKYDVTMGHAAWYILANGIMFSKPWSDFMRVWHATYSEFEQNFQLYSNIKPNIISLRVPNLIHIENTSLCRPNYGERAFLFDEGRLWNWKNKNYVVHLYMRAFEEERYEELNPFNIKTMNTTVGEIARYIYLQQ